MYEVKYIRDCSIIKERIIYRNIYWQLNRETPKSRLYLPFGVLICLLFSNFFIKESHKIIQSIWHYYAFCRDTNWTSPQLCDYVRLFCFLIHFIHKVKPVILKCVACSIVRPRCDGDTMFILVRWLRKHIFETDALLIPISKGWNRLNSVFRFMFSHLTVFSREYRYSSPYRRNH